MGSFVCQNVDTETVEFANEVSNRVSSQGEVITRRDNLNGSSKGGLYSLLDNLNFLIKTESAQQTFATTPRVSLLVLKTGLV